MQVIRIIIKSLKKIFPIEISMAFSSSGVQTAHDKITVDVLNEWDYNHMMAMC